MKWKPASPERLEIITNWQKRNPEKVKAAKRRYREKHPEKSKEYYIQNKAKIQEQNRQRYQANKEAHAKKNREDRPTLERMIEYLNYEEADHHKYRFDFEYV